MRLSNSLDERNYRKAFTITLDYMQNVRISATVQLGSSRVRGKGGKKVKLRIMQDVIHFLSKDGDIEPIYLGEIAHRQQEHVAYAQNPPFSLYAHDYR